MTGTDTPQTFWIIGGGTVAQCYAHLLLRGGARVEFIVRPGRAARLERGFTVIEVGYGGPRSTSWEPSGQWGVHLDLPVDEEVPTAVVLALDSTALRSEWTRSRLAGRTGDATVVVLPPGLHDVDAVGEMVGAAHVIPGLITLVAWPEPLDPPEPPDADDHDECTAVWFPPLTPLPFGGERSRAEAVIDALRAGGGAATYAPQRVAQAPLMSAVMVTSIAALESAGWSLAALRGPAAELGTAAAREALQVVEAVTGRTAPFGLRMVARASLLRLLTRIAPVGAPFPLEPYLRVHFSKVGAQTRQHLQTFIEEADARAFGATALCSLLDALPAMDADDGRTRPTTGRG